MTLVAVLLALALERWANRSRYWQIERYAGRYYNELKQSSWLAPQRGLVALLLVVFPPLLLAAVMSAVDHGLLEFVLATAVLIVCIGNNEVRNTYKSFLQAAERSDVQACSLYAEQLTYERYPLASFGQSLVWLNYRHYVAVILWFIALGASGALLYSLTVAFNARFAHSQSAASFGLNRLMYVLDWLPVRVTSLGLLLVGHFSRALPVWFTQVLNIKLSARPFLVGVAKAADDVVADPGNLATEPMTLVRLAKRNIKFVLALLALFTLLGWVN